MRRKADVIPAWDPDGIIPAHDPIDPTSHARSPYTVSLLDVMTRFGNTEARRDLLQKWLDFRAALHRLGITRGFQWIDGSFVENIEQTRNRPPNDIDLVTFLYIPAGYTGSDLLQRYPRLFNPGLVKEHYAMDAYCVQLNQIPTEKIVAQSLYWYSLWSHTRTGRWKGYLQVELAPDHDAAAHVKLETGGR